MKDEASRKTFHSRLFRRKIKPLNPDYWFFLYAEALYRLRELQVLNCPCTNCFGDIIKTKNLLERIEKEGHIPPLKHPLNFTRIGDCGRKLPPRA